MDMNAWKQYMFRTEDAIVQDLIQEEIDQQSRYLEQVSFRCVVKKRITTSILCVIPALALLWIYLTNNPLDRHPAGVIPVVLLTLFWMFRVCRIDNKNVVQYLAGEAKRSPDVPFRQLVEENIQERRTGLFGSRSFHVLLALAVLLGSLSIPITDRLSEMRVDGMIFKSYQDGCILVDCVRDFTTVHVVIPEQVEGKTVIAIDSGAFMDERGIVSVSIPDTVTAIGAEAFSGCTKLESIVIPPKVTEIRGNCFENCTHLQQVTLHEGIRTIRGYAFHNCFALEQIELPSGITEIRGNCFENCRKLKSIVIPEGVTRIAAHAFMGCYELESVTVPSTVREIGSSAFRQCRSLYTIELPVAAVVNGKAFKESPTNIIWK